MKINEAKDLDHVIEAHDTFLNQVMTRALMDNESRVRLRFRCKVSSQTLTDFSDPILHPRLKRITSQGQGVLKLQA